MIRVKHTASKIITVLTRIVSDPAERGMEGLDKYQLQNRITDIQQR